MHSSAETVAHAFGIAPAGADGRLAGADPRGAAAAARDASLLRRAGIAGLGTALPEGVVASDAIADRIGVPSGWLERRTGIHARRHAAPGARLTELAADAGRAALANAGIDAAEIDLVLVATATADEIIPNAAPQVAYEIGATAAGAMDVGAACTGFVSALTLGSSLIESRRATRVLVIGAEILSRHLDPANRSTAGLFGDGAGAVVLVPSEGGHAVGQTVFGADGAAAPFIYAPHDTALIEMNGHETFKRAVTTLANNAIQAVAANGLELDDIALFVLHQANGRILSAVAELLAVERERVLDVIAEVGNTSAASIPLALAEARSRGLLHDGDRVLLGAVGAGFTWGATVVEWGQP